MSQPPPRAHAAAALASAALCAALLATRSPDLADLDSANFAHALERYDLALHAPHFPGYPVYVAASRAAHAVVGDRVLALQLPGALTWSAAVGIGWSALARHHGTRAATCAALVLALLPLAWVTAGRAGSDAMGAGMLLLACAALARSWPVDGGSGRWLAAGGALLGLTLGVRLSYAPAVVGLGAVLLAHPARWRGVAAGVVATASWVVPQVIAVGQDGPELAARFLAGHFTEWGGAASVPEETSLALRAARWLAGLAVYGLGLPPPLQPARLLWAALVLPAGALGLRALPRSTLAFLAAGAVPYALWLWLGQNPDKPRHLLPLLPPLAVAVGVGLSRLPLAPAAALPLLLVTAPVAWSHATTPSPAAQLARWLRSEERPGRVQLFAGQSARVVGAAATGFRVEYAADRAAMERRLDLLPFPPPVLLWTDEVSSSPPGGHTGTEVARFARDPLVDPHGTELRLFRSVSAAPGGTPSPPDP